MEETIEALACLVIAWFVTSEVIGGGPTPEEEKRARERRYNRLPPRRDRDQIIERVLAEHEACEKKARVHPNKPQ